MVQLVAVVRAVRVARVARVQRAARGARDGLGVRVMTRGRRVVGTEVLLGVVALPGRAAVAGVIWVSNTVANRAKKSIS